MSWITKAVNIKLSEKYIPWVLLGVSVIAYGVMIHALGYYWDDWEILYLSAAAETPSDIFLYPFRPLHVLLDIVSVRLIGFNPLPWHILMLVIRFLGGLVFWALLKAIWPGHKARNTWAAVVFLVYPSFLQQSMAVVYRQHFTTALFYLFSVYLMVLSVKAWQQNNKKRFWPLLAFSVVFGVAHLFITEYYAPLELWRLFILIILFSQEKTGWKKSFGSILKFWLPYMSYIAAYMVWRLRYVPQLIDDPNKAIFLDQLRSSPIQTLLDWIMSSFLDFRYMLLGSWFDALNEGIVNFRSLFSLLALLLMAISAIGLYWFMNRVIYHHDENYPKGNLDSIVLGFLGLFLGLVPVWLMGRNLYTGAYNTRFTIPALPGVSLLVVSLIFSIFSEKWKLNAWLSILVAIAIGRQIHMNNTFRWDWQQQVRTMQQVRLRAPGIEPETGVLVNKAVSKYSSTYPNGYTLNFLYNPDEPSLDVDYWWFEVFYNRIYGKIGSIQKGNPIYFEFHNILFESDPGGAIVFDLPSGDLSRCIWLLTPDDNLNQQIQPEMTTVAQVSNPDRIIRQGSPTFLDEIFETDSTSTWCSYYQQADLAVQFQDWDSVNSIYDVVQDKGLSSKYGHEYLPFISGSFAVQDWSQSADLSLRAFAMSKELGPSLCESWQTYGEDVQNQAAYVEAFSRVQAELICDNE